MIKHYKVHSREHWDPSVRLGASEIGVNCVLQHVKKAGGTFSGWKMDICIPEVVAVGHCCTYEGNYQRIRRSRRSGLA